MAKAGCAQKRETELTSTVHGDGAKPLRLLHCLTQLDLIVISSRTVREIQRQLLHLRCDNSNWLAFSTEVQDGGQTLLISLEMPKNLDKISYAKAASTIRDICTAKISDQIDNYSWMVVISAGGEVVEALMSELLLE